MMRWKSTWKGERSAWEGLVIWNAESLCGFNEALFSIAVDISYGCHGRAFHAVTEPP